MKKEQFALENATIVKDEKNCFHRFTMHVYEEDNYGIICDSIEERNVMISFFSGMCEITEGHMKFEHKIIKNGGLNSIFKNKITVIQKKSKLIDNLSIIENICIFADGCQWVNEKRYLEIAERYLQKFNLSFNLSKPVDALSEKERVMVELLKAYAENKKVIVLTDISNFLQAAEMEEIHQLCLAMNHEQRTFILIEPFGDLIFNWTNQLLIIKDGTDLGCFETRFVDRQKLYNFLSSRKKGGSSIEEGIAETEEDTFQMIDLVSSSLNKINISAGKGDVVKILCLDGKSLQGMKTLILGKEKALEGEMILAGKKITMANPRDMKKNGVGFCREMAYKSMLIPDMTVRDNLMMDLSFKVPNIWLFRKYGRNIDNFIEQEFGREYSGRKLRDLPPSQLLRLAYAKFYLTAPKIIFLEKPFLDMDLHMKEITLKAIKDFGSRGMITVILTMNLADISLVDGETVYLKNGNMVDEDEAYQTFYNI